MWEMIRNSDYWRSKFPGIVLLGTTGTITGTATANYIVRLCPGGPTIVADNAGAFRFNMVPIGTYTIISYSPGMTEKGVEEIEVETDTTTVVTFSYSASADCRCP